MEIDGGKYMCPMKKIREGVHLEMSCLTIVPIYLKYLYDRRGSEGSLTSCYQNIHELLYPKM
jgi:hypothetical protein